MSKTRFKPKINSSMYAALAAGVVSISALAVSIYEAWLMREQQAASVLPIIDFWTGYGGDDGYTVNVANKGLGPAFIRDIRVSVEGDDMQNWSEVITALTGRTMFHNEANLAGNVVAQGETGEMFAIEDIDDATEFWQQTNRISMTFCYCAVFKDCWQTTIADVNVGTPTTTDVKSCPAPRANSF